MSDESEGPTKRELAESFYEAVMNDELDSFVILAYNEDEHYVRHMIAGVTRTPMQYIAQLECLKHDLIANCTGSLFDDEDDEDDEPIGPVH